MLGGFWRRRAKRPWTVFKPSAGSCHASAGRSTPSTASSPTRSASSSGLVLTKASKGVHLCFLAIRVRSSMACARNLPLTVVASKPTSFSSRVTYKASPIIDNATFTALGGEHNQQDEQDSSYPVHPVLDPSS